MSVRVEPEALTRYHVKMETAAAKAIYQQRAPVAEFPNAWLKTKLKWVKLQSRGLLKAAAVRAASRSINTEAIFAKSP